MHSRALTAPAKGILNGLRFPKAGQVTSSRPSCPAKLPPITAGFYTTPSTFTERFLGNATQTAFTLARASGVGYAGQENADNFAKAPESASEAEQEGSRDAL
jgi:hypothetical protein